MDYVVFNSRYQVVWSFRARDDVAAQAEFAHRFILGIRKVDRCCRPLFLTRKNEPLCFLDNNYEH